jgi:hypothetical protein
MAELKTKPTGESLEAFLNTIGDEGRRRDCAGYFFYPQVIIA